MQNQLDEVFNDAMKAFENNVATIPIQIEVLRTEQNVGGNLIIDKVIKLTIGEKQIRYYVELKNNLNQAFIGLMAQRRNMLPGPLLLVAHHVNDVMAVHLKKNRIEFIDAAGNAYINQPPIYINIIGNKIKDKYQNTRLGQAFQPTGLRVVFAFLCKPQIINENYRTIARAAGVALGNIGGTILDLKRQGFLLDMVKQGYILTQRRRLIDRFIEEYPKKLRHRLFLGKFTGDRDWGEKEVLPDNDVLWGGEVAAAKMGNFLKPQLMTLYLKQDLFNGFLLKNRLKRDPNGDVEILKMFWDPTLIPGHNNLVHPILAYADLIATANQRNIEAAKVLYEQYIVRLIGED